jgi:polyisoprenyl-phosphate glycosyltransferase
MKASIVIPVFNSSRSIPELVNRIIAVFDELAYDFELIFVDDYSEDDSWQVLNQVKDTYTNQAIKIIRLSKNFGQHNATICGFNYCNGDFVITMDDDLQHPPEEIPKLIHTFIEKKADVIYGTAKSGHSLIRKLFSSLLKLSAKKLEKHAGIGSSFRVISIQVVDNLRKHNSHFIFIDYLIQWYTSNIHIAKINHHKRKHGKSNYSIFGLLSLVGGLTIFYSTFLLRLMVFLGILGAFISFLVGLYFFVKKIFFMTPVEGFTSLITAILFSTSLILLSLGIIGQYLGQMYLTLNNKPIFNVKDEKL